MKLKVSVHSICELCGWVALLAFIFLWMRGCCTGDWICVKEGNARQVEVQYKEK